MRRRPIIVKTVARWVAGFVFLYGLYIVVFGHLSPGGGFAGGVILACAFVLQLLAMGKKRARRSLPLAATKVLDSAGALAFLALALLGLVAGIGFFDNFLGTGERFHVFSAGIIPLCNIAVAVKVCASLALVSVVLAVLRVTANGTDEDLRSEEEE